MSYNPLLEEIPIDDVINQIGLGLFHYKILFLEYFIVLNQVSQVALPGIILPSLTTEFNLSKTEISMYGTFEYFGYFVASIAIGKISDLFGRKKGILLFQLIWLISMIISCLSPNIYFFSLLRCIISTSFMIVAFCGFSLLSEIWPQKTRGVVLNFSSFISVLAYTLTSLISRFLISDLKTANWRFLFILYAISLTVSLALNYKFLEESPRYDLFLGRKSRAFATIEKMALTNLHQENFLQHGKKEQIERWAESFTSELSQVFNDEKKENRFMNNYKKLFKSSYKKITIIMFILWTVVSSNTFGTEFILAKTFLTFYGGTDKNPLNFYFYINVIVLPCLLPLIAMVEMKNFGRKRTLSICFFIMGVGGVNTFLGVFPGPIFWLCLLKISEQSSFMLIYLFTAELYPTSIRMNAMGQCSAISRIGVMLIVWVAVFLSDINTFLPFLIYGLMGFLAFFTISLLPYETLNENIDRVISS